LLLNACHFVATGDCHRLAEGREEDVRKLWPQLLSGGGVRGLLLHGRGGVGKSALAILLANHLDSTGAFPGGVYVVSLQFTTQYIADTDALLYAQQQLLCTITQQQVPKPRSLDVGAAMLEKSLRGIQLYGAAPRPVLLVIDNVPEGGSGVMGLLPSNLQDCLPDG
jgi:hypothetical protein